jgi:4-oxalocrotonate tautomerase
MCLPRRGLNILPARACLADQQEDPMPEITINLVAGRTEEAKKALMYDITQAVMKNCNVPADAVVVQIVEAAPADKMKGGQTFVERMKK